MISWEVTLHCQTTSLGTVDSVDRMIRLEYYLTTSPEPKTEAESIAFVRSLISSSNVPFGAPYGGGVYPTWWASFIDVSMLFCMRNDVS